MWDLPGPGHEPVSPALAGGFLTTAPPGKPQFFIFLINLFIYLFLAVLGLHCCVRAFSSCGERGLLFVAVCGLLIVVASLCCGAWALDTQASVVVAHGLSSCGSRALECRLGSGGAWA